MAFPVSTQAMIGQMFLCGFEGTSLPEGVRDLFDQGQAGGAVLFGRNCQNPAQIQSLTQEISSIPSKLPLWIAVDQEGGRVRRLRSPFTELPPAAVLGLLDQKEEDAEAFGAILGEEAKAAGFHIVFAPVLDVHTNPANPVIGDRALSSQADRVALLGKALAKGLSNSGVMPCGKHFPGHGDTHQDSHIDLPCVAHPRQRLESIELLPFRAAVEASIPAIMSSHILFPALDPVWPATLSPLILDGILRKTWGYEGLIVSDDLEMKGIAAHSSIEEIAIQGVLAGIDLFLICKEWPLILRATAALQDGLHRGILSEERLWASYQRILRAKERFATPAPTSEITAFLDAGGSRRQKAALFHKAWGEASTGAMASASPNSPATGLLA